MNRQLAFLFILVLLMRGCDNHAAFSGVGSSPTLYLGLGTGQSLSVGHVSLPVTTGTGPPGTYMFSTGTRAGLTDDGNTAKVLAAGSVASIVPLLESADGVNAGETISTTLATWWIKNRPPFPIVEVQLGVSSTRYAFLKQGTQPYNNMLTAVTGAQAIATAAGEPLIVPFMTVIHGESDELAGTTQAAYNQDLKDWQSNIDADVKTKETTAQTQPVLLYTDQMSSWTTLSTATTAVIPYAQLEASVESPTKIFLVAPKYFLTYVSGAHLTAASEARLGEYYGRAILAGSAWKPVSPIACTRVTNVVNCTFNVPTAPLVLDTTTVTSPNGAADGFEWFDDGGPSVTVSSVAIHAGGTSVDITLSGTPTGTPGSFQMRYAYTGTVSAAAGPTTGPRGCLRDSAADVSPSSGLTMYNWCVHFSQPST